MIALIILITVVFSCWWYGRLSLLWFIIPAFLVLIMFFEFTGHFSSYDLTIRDASTVYNQQEYSKQMDEWFENIKDCNGRCVSVISLPQVSENGTKSVWVEFAYQPHKEWYEPSGAKRFK